MGRGRRNVLAVAVTVVCAVTVLGASGTAFASAGPDPAPTSTATAPAATTPSTPSAPPVTAPPDQDLEAVRTKLDELYHDAAVATDAYNAAEEKSKRQSAEVVGLSQKIVEQQRKLDELKDRAGAAARAQYRTGGLPPQAQLLLSNDPQHFLDGAGRVLEGERATSGLLQEMTRTQQDLQQYAADAADQLHKLEDNRKAKATAQKRIQARVKEAEQLEARLEKRQQERLAQLEREAAQQAQAAWLGTGILKEIGGSATEAGKKAVQYATAQIGKPYEWGAEGPKTYDCSGLTSQAWAAAGHPVPRTSQEQWKQLKHVSVKDMRPGDLIIYFGDASHVAMYVGKGLIVHAPRPGRTVTLAGAGTMPILGVVRPDAS
ncbi:MULTISPECIES: C40 family peptidase [unclassified Streptomyces]|uniref:C40 family peptidase n=1 Tax=unclassified Streptomyces TaxID=2593676 RepID=UPI0003A49BAA|nr:MULTISPECIES: C40 family peptidase [unclassified Streptomyces]EYT79039.1 glycoside hydrolase [Streptomyces sp. Tu 6176]